MSMDYALYIAGIGVFAPALRDDTLPVHSRYAVEFLNRASPSSTKGRVKQYAELVPVYSSVPSVAIPAMESAASAPMTNE